MLELVSNTRITWRKIRDNRIVQCVYPPKKGLFLLFNYYLCLFMCDICLYTHTYIYIWKKSVCAYDIYICVIFVLLMCVYKVDFIYNSHFLNLFQWYRYIMVEQFFARKNPMFEIWVSTKSGIFFKHWTEISRV